MIEVFWQFSAGVRLLPIKTNLSFSLSINSQFHRSLKDAAPLFHPYWWNTPDHFNTRICQKVGWIRCGRVIKPEHSKIAAVATWCTQVVFWRLLPKWHTGIIPGPASILVNGIVVSWVALSSSLLASITFYPFIDITFGQVRSSPVGLLAPCKISDSCRAAVSLKMDSYRSITSFASWSKKSILIPAMPRSWRRWKNSIRALRITQILWMFPDINPYTQFLWIFQPGFLPNRPASGSRSFPVTWNSNQSQKPFLRTPSCSSVTGHLRHQGISRQQRPGTDPVSFNTFRE